MMIKFNAVLKNVHNNSVNLFNVMNSNLIKIAGKYIKKIQINNTPLPLLNHKIS